MNRDEKIKHYGLLTSIVFAGLVIRQAIVDVERSRSGGPDPLPFLSDGAADSLRVQAFNLAAEIESGASASFEAGTMSACANWSSGSSGSMTRPTN